MRTTEEKKELTNYLDQFEIIDMISKRTNYYKYQVKEVMDVFEEIIYEKLQEATVDKPSECRLFFGFILGAKRVPEQMKKMPNSDNDVYIPEHLNPYTRIKDTFKKKVNNYQNEESEYVDKAIE